VKQLEQSISVEKIVERLLVRQDRNETGAPHSGRDQRIAPVRCESMFQALSFAVIAWIKLESTMAGQQLTGRLLAAGRTLAGIGMDDLSAASGTPLETIQLLEASGAAWVSAADAGPLLAALEAFGIVIIPERDGMGAGVRLKFTRQDTKQIVRLENEGGIPRLDDLP
jgi:hypothetical protein